MLMQSCLFSLVFLCVIARAAAADEALDWKLLTRVPDLSPLLSGAEVSPAMARWKTRVDAIASKGLSTESAKDMVTAKTELLSRLPKATKVTFYSLVPAKSAELKTRYPARAAEFESLPKFHDYPVLGSVVIGDAKEVDRWTGFFRDQILPGGDFLCGFMPRHGIRFSTGESDTDLVICFSCDQLAWHGPGKLDQTHNPVFSPAVMDILNLLFDKRSIERDKP